LAATPSPSGIAVEDLSTMIRLLTLLSRRRKTSLKSIKKLCDISESTACKYLDILSEAGIPVCHDTSSRSYNISGRRLFNLSEVGLDDAVIIVVALHLLSRRVNGLYKKDADSLLKRVLMCQSYPLEDVWQAFKHLADSKSHSIEISDLITILVVHLAAMSGRQLCLSLEDIPDQPSSVVIDKPFIKFRGTWMVHDKGSGLKDAVAVSNIKRARFVPARSTPAKGKK
jgi:predicted DNA-binding transcriptional regulator YafY